MKKISEKVKKLIHFRFQVTPLPKERMSARQITHARGRGASISEQGRMKRKKKRSMSANAGMPALAEPNLRTILTRERVPHMDHYRQSIDHRKSD